MPKLNTLATLIGGSVLALLLTSLVAHAADTKAADTKADSQADSKDEAVSIEVASAITKGLAKARPQLKIESIRPSPIPGLYRTQILGGPVLFVSEDGSHMLAADMYRIELGNFVNLQDLERHELRVTLAKQLDDQPEDLIVYSPKGDVKGVVNVFTDVDCGYCQKLHREIPELNKLGIELRYLAYPRAGIGSKSYNKIASAWCADDQNKAMDALKSRQNIEDNVCTDNPVAKHFLVGSKVGVTGTPALLLADGTLLPGYLPAKELAARMGITQ